MHKEREESKHSRTATTHQVRPPKEVSTGQPISSSDPEQRNVVNISLKDSLIR